MRRISLTASTAVAVTLLAYIAASACSLDEAGSLQVNDGGDVGDVDAGDDAPACSACVDLLAAGWQLVAFGPPDASCPASFSAESVVHDVDATPATCDCACDAPPGACQAGVITETYGLGCASSPAQLSVNGSCASPSTFPLSSGYQIDFAPYATGPCTARVITNDAGVTSTPGIVCHPVDTCDETLCTSSDPNFSSCVQQMGQVVCPPGPFNKQIFIASSSSVTCSACTCTNGTESCTGTLDYYTDFSCTLVAEAVPVGSGCLGAEAGTIVNSLKWNAAVLDSGCTPQGQRQATLSLNDVRTLCCR